MYGERWAAKPPPGTQIDQGYPWSLGIQGFYALNEGTGSVLTDSVHGTNLTTSAFGSNNPWGTASQRGLLCTAANEGALGTVPVSLQSPWPITVAGAGRFTGTPSGGAYITGIAYNSAGASPYGILLIFLDSGALWLSYNSAGTASFTSGGPTPSVGVDYVWSATITSNSQTLYVNGVKVVGTTNAAANPNWTSTSQAVIGVSPASSGTNANAIFYWSGWWARNFSANDHAALFGVPNAIWQIFTPRRDVRRYVPGGTVTAGSSYRGGSALFPLRNPITGPTITTVYG